MKEFSNIISVYPLSELTNENLTPWISDIIGSHNFLADDFTFEPNLTESESGSLFNCDKTLNVSKPSASDVALFSYPVNCIIVFKDTNNSRYAVGSKTMPATVQIQNNLQKSQLIIKANTLTSPF